MSSPKKPDDARPPAAGRFSRRGFLRGAGISGGVLGATGLLAPEEAEAQAAPRVAGPDAVPVSLKINGRAMNATIEPRETLLDVMRNHLNLTAAKRVCDRGTCGACTVMVDGKAMYACTILAIDAQGREIQTCSTLA